MKFRHSFIYLFILFFLRTYFSGKLELELETPSDLTEAKSLSQSYPKLKAWTSFIESITTSDLERGFLQNPEGYTEFICQIQKRKMTKIGFVTELTL